MASYQKIKEFEEGKADFWVTIMGIEFVLTIKGLNNVLNRMMEE